MGQPNMVSNIGWRYCRIRQIVIEYWLSVGVGQADRVWNISWQYCRIRWHTFQSNVTD
jgi:ribosomal protein S16